MVGWVAKLIMPIGLHLLNREGIYGGALATVLDTAMGFAGSYTGDPDKPHIVMTLNLSVNYMAKASGTRLITTANVTGGGYKTFFAEARVSDELGTVAATATGVSARFKGYSQPRFRLMICVSASICASSSFRHGI